MIARLALALSMSVLAACGGAIPSPPAAPHTGDTPITVPSMPPPGRVEIVPPSPATLKNAVWIDGEWEWTGRRWAWKSGRWEELEPGAAWAGPLTVRTPDGSLSHFKGTWKKGAPAR